MSFVRVLLLASTVLLACYLQPASVTPFNVPPTSFFDSVHTVVVTSASVVGEISIADSALSDLEALIEETLSDANLIVVPASEYASIWERIVEESGGFFDPFTGERDEERYQTAAARLRREVLERFHPDALLYPEIWEVEAPFSVGTAYWGGITQAISGGSGYSGDVLAASLFVAIQDTSGNELYAREAGIEVLEFMQDGELSRLPPERLFSDSTWIPTAVSGALDPLLEARPVLPPEER